eukprot:scaffold2036_cov256-Pinguiococcus_pyrenoidosus.AAC.8
MELALPAAAPRRSPVPAMLRMVAVLRWQISRTTVIARSMDWPSLVDATSITASALWILTPMDRGEVSTLRFAFPAMPSGSSAPRPSPPPLSARNAFSSRSRSLSSRFDNEVSIMVSAPTVSPDRSRRYTVASVIFRRLQSCSVSSRAYVSFFTM